MPGDVPTRCTLTAQRVLAVDGVVWSAPDSTDNRQVLGSGQTQHGPQPWPRVRAVCLLDTDSHEPLDAQLGDCMPVSQRARQLRPELPSHWHAPVWCRSTCSG
jgi:hypothetical protein